MKKTNNFIYSRIIKILISLVTVSILLCPSFITVEMLQSQYGSSYGLVSEEEAVAIANLWYCMELNSGYIDIDEAERNERLENLQNSEVFYLVSGGKIIDKIPENGCVLAYIVKYQPSGFVVVTGSDRIQPIIAFDVKSEFKLVDPEEDAIIDFLCYSVPLLWDKLGLEVNSNWKNLRFNLQEKKELTKITFSNLENSIYVHWETPLWDQGKPYNELVLQKCGVPGVVTGCEATAQAIKMRFHEWPIKGTGSKDFSDTDGAVQFYDVVDFSACTYDWDNMAYEYNKIEDPPNSDNWIWVDENGNLLTQVNFDAVAELMYHCGVALNMNYEVGGSTSSYNTEEIEEIFSYKGTKVMVGLEELFTIDSGYQRVLNDSFGWSNNKWVWNGIVPNEIMQLFSDNGHVLSSNLVMRKSGKIRWLIIDSGNYITYDIRLSKKEDLIRIYHVMESYMAKGVKPSILGGLPVLCNSQTHSMVIDGYRETLQPFYSVNQGDSGRTYAWIDLFLKYDDTDGLPGAWIQCIYPYCSPSNYMYVDPSSTEHEDGCFLTPFKSFSDGYEAVPSDGHLWLKAGTYNLEGVILDKPLTIHACLGEGPVILPKSKVIHTPLQQFLEDHPLIYQLFQRFLKL